MKHASLFSGIGGFDLAAEWMGWDNVFHCEWNPFGQRILKHYWPNSISYEDISKVDFRRHRGTIDIITGGFPCQPYSSAGKRLGKEDDRHLWPEMLRAIREIQPRYVVGENVLGLTNWNGGMVFEEVCVDLEFEGYEVQPFIRPAASVNAPHRRDRVWFIAHSTSERDTPPGASEETKRNGGGNDGESEFRGDATNAKSESSGGKLQQRQRKGESRGQNSGDATTTHSNSRRQPREEYGKAETGRTTKKSLSDDWQNFPTEPPICGGDDGLPTKLDGITFPKWRNESIKGYVNAIVPQVAYQIFKAINEMEST
jgi:DNA (cytosine-5)-methyltransferase 1